MSSPTIRAIRAQKNPFIPHKPEMVSIGRTSCWLYRKVDENMSDPEKALAFQHNKTALAGADLDQRARILTLADRLNLMLTAEAGLADWERKLSKNWSNFQYLTILSWHNDKGDRINDTTTAVDTSVLLPVQDGAVADCRSSGVKFVRVQLELDFADLTIVAAAANAPNVILRGEYYIQLPQSSRDLLNGNQVAYKLTSWLGPSDLRAMSRDDVQRQILDITHQDGPFDLLTPSFNMTSCRTDSTAAYGELKSLVVRLASDTIHRTMFMELVPGYSIEPHNVLDHIWQCYVDADGKTVKLGAQVYYSTFLNAIRSFYDLEEYPIDLAGVFQDHIDPSLQKGFRAHYPLYGQTRTRAALIQRSILVDMLNALIKAENDLTNIREIVRLEQGGGEQFHSSGRGQANPSLAERTIRAHGADGPSDGRKPPSQQECFGCGGPHSWSSLIDNKYVVTCENADKPGVRERAELNILKFQARKKKNARNNKKRRNLNTVNWEDIPEKRREVLAAQARGTTVVSVGSASAASSAASTMTGSASPAGIIRRGNVTLHQDVVILSTQSSKPQIPIAIHSPMPHLSLQTGTSKEEKDCPALRCMLDTGASLSTANFHYMEAVVRQYPHILKAIYLPDDYAAIVLSGIVTSSTEAPITTELSVGFEIHLPYVTKDGNDTSLLVAAGPDVAVNLILGLPFIKATGMIADFIDNVCEAKHLVCDPFPIDFRRAVKSVPVSGDRDAPSHSVEFKEVLHALSSIKAFFAHSAGISPTDRKEPTSKLTALPEDNDKRVSFGFKRRWVPPSKSADDTNDYIQNVLGDMGYL
jgi:hypothetical protein